MNLAGLNAALLQTMRGCHHLVPHFEGLGARVRRQGHVPAGPDRTRGRHALVHPKCPRVASVAADLQGHQGMKLIWRNWFIHPEA